MKQSSAIHHDNMTFMPTSTVVLQTSLGNLYFDLAGAQFPLLTAQFVNLARSKYWNGVVVREVIPNIAAFFAHDTDSYTQHMFTNVQQQENQESNTSSEVNNLHNNKNNTELERTVMSPLPLNFWELYERAIKWKNNIDKDKCKNNYKDFMTSDEQRERIREEVYKSKKHFVSGLHVRISRSVQTADLIVSKEELSIVRKGNNKNNNINSNSKLMYSPFHINRAGLLLVEVTSGLTAALQHTHTGVNMYMKEALWHYHCKFAITLSNNRNMDYLINKNYTVIGAISEGDNTHGESWQTLKKIRLCPLTSDANVEMQPFVSSSSSSLLYAKNFRNIEGYKRRSIVHSDIIEHSELQIYTNNTHSSSRTVNNMKHECFPRPIRAIRVAHVYVLPTLGAQQYVHSSNLTKSKHSANSTETSVVARSLENAGCFRYWANAESVKLVNAYLAHLVSIQTQLIEESTCETENKNESKEQQHLHLQRTKNLCSATTSALTSKNSVKCGNTYKSIIRLPETTKDENNDNCGDDIVSDSESLISFEVLDPNAVEKYNNTTSSSSLYNTASEEIDQHQNSSSSSNVASNNIDNIISKSKDQRIDESLSLMMNLLDGITDLTIRPAPNVLFVCKLNPITDEVGLQICFSQFGVIKAINVIRDKHTQRSLCYAFIEFDTVDSCAAAFQKMNNVLIDDFRIKVDFSQSVSKVWRDKQQQRNKRARTEEQESEENKL